MHISYNRAKEWSSHFTLLIKAILASKGPVVEVGAGFFSTPLLHWLCKSLDKKLVTYENTQEFYDFAKRFQSPLHKIKFIENWDAMDFETRWGVVFIDHHPPERRGVDVINFKDTADYIVIHDTNDSENKYNYQMAWPHFKYRYDWVAYKPWASVVSNTVDVSKWDNNVLNV
ncbi:MAG: hypothetical protein UT61_C0050G0003 [Candidatus Woesebacteria bacterium GW2011_GWA1_39_8]|uniref:Uncharacterized protein n=1 Tax=Candidatus Woesebacteria bacterium GW2011_GWA1_39_8 TaxID=1618552 RepID=A0A0G0PJN1_9BACT|nr:MAG: hypothetical protein UT61_C0050G0003 [Candidatus Woesebacteria bacterium GW2011_GWA1_39_8]